MIDFIRFKNLYFALSLLIIIPGIISLALYGLPLSVDFAGGSLLEVEFSQSISQEQVKRIAEQAGKATLREAQPLGEKGYLLRLNRMSEEEKNSLVESYQQQLGETDIAVKRFESVGPAIGKESLIKALFAVILSAGFILFYIARQFKDSLYGVSAVLAMLHDTLILFGSWSLLGHFFGAQADTLFVTAVLTILSFSVHDTVVVYDRIREALKYEPKADFVYLANKAVTETISRSLNNSLTIIFMLLALVLLGGETIRWFVIALLIGTVAGTYSSTFTAVPLLVTLRRRKTN